MEFFSIASGSSGNCICVGNNDTHILIDAGISGKRIDAGMAEYDLKTSDAKAILVTHEHSDHIQGLGVLARKYHIPIYTTIGTMDAIINCNSLGRIDRDLLHVIKPGEAFSIDSLTIEPVAISHDAADPAAYITSCVENGVEKRIGVMTDLGNYNESIVDAMHDLNGLLLEANHDVRMLQVGSYPYPLKQRILSDYGHLSNERSGQLLSRILHDNMGEILLGHLSKENNLPDLAYEAVCLEVDSSDTPYKKTDFPISVAPRDTVSHKIVL